MNKTYLNKLIIKLIENTISRSESEKLKTLLQNQDNLDYFNQFVELNHLINSKQSFSSNDSLQKVMANLKKKRKTQFYKYAMAASLVVLLGLSYFLNKEKKGIIDNTPVIVESKFKPGTDKAILTLESGEEVTLVKGTSFQIQNASSNGEKIVYSKAENKEISYNYLTVPRGGQFKIILSDGTQVWLNSESQLKYPKNFKEGETRKVELVYGEAYFDVSPYTEHNGAKFEVYNKSQQVQVLGTEFNIKAYRDETDIYTTLIEGKVSVSSENSNQVLKPNQQVKLNLNDNTVTVFEVNGYNETSWKDGIFSFRRKPLKEIMKVLSRWYDVDFNFENPDLEKLGFNGVLGKAQNIEEILEAIKGFGVIENYEINNKTIILR